MTSIPLTAHLSWAGGAPCELLPRSALAVLGDTHGQVTHRQNPSPAPPLLIPMVLPPAKQGGQIPVRFGLFSVSQQMNTQQDTH